MCVCVRVRVLLRNGLLKNKGALYGNFPTTTKYTQILNQKNMMESQILTNKNDLENKIKEFSKQLLGNNPTHMRYKTNKRNKEKDMQITIEQTNQQTKLN